ncbi:FmdB family zinc ribbon protein [Limnobacter parvus]|uniref:Zinc ribbon domain-containing protein n=1 Tax=Limnobacter parvus TaxID=2939690 RepID=A0ABT1XI02_9BURK|nr:FmdB family zinc ribbon protein [Limnobacter parvus]MCR2745907.1 zinc ribbon domain-containing protein [Limnobacter parvus]
MPIYAYRCEACGFEKDVLQKLSDSPLTQCPSCGQASFSKQVTAAGFQLKGSGWYVTDFRGGNSVAGGSKPKETTADTTTSAASNTAAAPTTPAPSTDAT